MAYYFTTDDYQKLLDNDVEFYLDGAKVTGAIQIPKNSKLEFIANSGTFFTVQDNWGDLISSVNFYYYDVNFGDSGYIGADELLDDNTRSVFNNFASWHSGISEFNLEIEQVITEPYYILTADDIDRLNDNNTKLYRNDIQLLEGDEIYSNDVIVAKTNEGYEFNLNQSLEPEIYFSGQNLNTGDFYYYRFSLNEDKNTGTLLINDDWEELSSKQGFFAYTSQLDDVSGSNYVYLVDADKLSEVNAQRFVLDYWGGSYDYGQFILGVVQLPFTIPDDYIQEPHDIYLADRNTGVKATKISNDLIKVDLGSIEVPLIHDNLLDFANTTALLHLPRVPPVNIGLEYIIGETINIEYLVSLYDGLTTVNVTSSKTGESISTISVDLGFNIPFANVPRQTLDNSNITIGGDNGVTIAFIEIVRNESILSDGVFTVPVADEKTLFNETGYIEVNNIELEGRIKLSNRQKIINLLTNGVIIK